MDVVKCSKIDTSCKSNKYHYFIKKALLFLVAVSLLSLLLSYISGFSFIFSYNFSLLNITFPTFCHPLERKYMFLICNGILAFLAKSLSFSSSTSSPGSDANVELTNSIEEAGVKTVSELSENKEALPEDEEVTTKYTLLENVALPEDEEQEENGHKTETHPYEACIEGRNGVLLTESEDSEGEGDEEAEESGTLIGSSPSEGANEVNVNTEELNKKFEEFIRKMKEELRIEAQQQLIAV